MKFVKGIAIGAAALLSLAACDQSMYGGGGGINKQTVGTVGGAVAGGLAGSQIGSGSGQLWATGAGVLLGAFLGGEIGKSLDRADRQAMGQTTYNALEHNPSGQTSRWQNPDSGHYGTVTPQATYQQGGYNCREYTQTVYIDGRSEQAHGTACRQPDGSWQIQN
ncbi:RT0821/Lpp0805 family surface protein [Parvibaculum sp.]|jgi:surface antigen|uniref:RT0821/Lpp0805 family surface protein n=2 Tax=Parvibaculum sp. TaxID=2024848 RepID=UPI001B06490F|nr:RT0821/Lpp0805 family surface protein [Parvibaculum sp.]MBO6678511.1 glycine zipper 2TM domain-containing protein [Parvibaculum sp.]MBO6685116.1 glycine zipper 2TM domain-containing protein [Parvibaculum sp.]MBO6904162.1 glycine zipper 2TM domain-containing protein [Parvibaculum sp.]